MASVTKDKRSRETEVGVLEGTRRVIGSGVPAPLAGGNMGVTDVPAQPEETPEDADRAARRSTTIGKGSGGTDKGGSAGTGDQPGPRDIGDSYGGGGSPGAGRRTSE
jgi:hypothetical protein